MRLIFIFTLLLLSACTPSTTPHKLLNIDQLKMSVVYGDDNRKDIYQVTDRSMLALASSTVALIRPDRLEALDANSMRIKSVSYAQTYSLCKSEPFYEQKTAAFCSGFLVGPQTVVTAGHCIKADSCAKTKFVFGFAIAKEGEEPTSVPNDNVYSCSQVVESQQKDQDKDYGPDFAVVSLDRPVTGFRPLEFRRSGQIAIDEPLFVVGHPAGLPTKVADGANVRDISKKAYFSANLDTYGGNSGSAVFNLNTGAIEGILVRGEIDYVTKKGENCQVSNVCANGGCMGEHVTRIEMALPYIN